MVLDALAARCGNGTWCLGYDLDKDLILGDSQLYMQYCDLGYCLGDIPDECMTPVSTLCSIIECLINTNWICALTCIGTILFGNLGESCQFVIRLVVRLINIIICSPGTYISTKLDFTSHIYVVIVSTCTCVVRTFYYQHCYYMIKKNNNSPTTTGVHNGEF